jgi:hypothetical protein
MVTFRIDAANRLVAITCTGPVTLNDLLATQTALRADPAFDPGFDLLFDLRQASLAGVDAGSLRRAAAGTPFAPSARRAYVAGDDAGFGVARMLQAFSEFEKRGDSVRVFRELDAALTWIRGAASATCAVDDA